MYTGPSDRARATSTQGQAQWCTHGSLLRRHADKLQVKVNAKTANICVCLSICVCLCARRARLQAVMCGMKAKVNATAGQPVCAVGSL